MTDDDFDAGELLSNEERDRLGDFNTVFGPRFPDPRHVVDRVTISGLRHVLANRCPFCCAPALELLDETTFEAQCSDCGRRCTKLALADEALHDPAALQRILEGYDGMWTLLAEEGRIP